MFNKKKYFILYFKSEGLVVVSPIIRYSSVGVIGRALEALAGDIWFVSGPVQD